ncbi:hypothetical protein INT43_008316 [Umbelopsis isabellina]|uniref:Thymidylate kinase n=1 Tax=Mortierella isabellina TaxID=91625 RepID=A0A8H7U7J0_MORIS|nr:hypothetical protein INT43_008316 [Umbelopsis isabellina]
MPPFIPKLFNMAKRGALIVVEGCDRSGKSTQCAKLVEYLAANNMKAQLLKFPGKCLTHRTTSTGQMINSYLTNAAELNDQAVHLLFSANRWEAMDNMRALLLSGTTLVVDRYAYSGVAFTAAKGLDISWCRNPDIGLLTPDLVLFLDLPIESAERRGGFGEERYEKRDMQIKVRELFLQMQDPLWKASTAKTYDT